MKIGGNYSLLRGRGLATGRRRVEKANAPSNLPAEMRRGPGPALPQPALATRARPSRFETGDCPDANRRGMQPRFVAQVLGQVLGGAPANALIVTRVYARSARDMKAMRPLRIL